MSAMLARLALLSAVLVGTTGFVQLGPPACDLSGRWRMEGDRLGRSTWVFEADGPGRYKAVETGLDNATGTVTVTGLRVEMDWRAANLFGYTRLMLDPGCKEAWGIILVSTGAGYGVTFTRP